MEPKKGIKTTEFWLSIVAFALSAVFASGLVTGEIWLQVLGVAASILGALGYTVSRSFVKASTAKADAIARLGKLGLGVGSSNTGDGGIASLSKLPLDPSKPSDV